MPTMKRRGERFARAVERQTTDHARRIELKRARGEMIEFYLSFVAMLALGGWFIYLFGG